MLLRGAGVSDSDRNSSAWRVTPSAYLETRLGRTQVIAFIDSVPLPVCHNRRIYSHQVFADYA